MWCSFNHEKIRHKICIKLFQNVLSLLLISKVNLCNGFVYTGHSAYGCFVAIAVPLNIPHHNAFVSYNFETAYGLPKDPKDLLPGPYQGFGTKEDKNENFTKLEILPEGSRKITLPETNLPKRNIIERTEKEPKPLITKRAIYKMIRDKLKISGLKGEDCLLRLVCEINSSQLGAYNGVLGSILHILISPSSTKAENLPNKFYKAESNGAVGDCFKYEKRCPYNLLDIFSVSLEDFLKKTTTSLNFVK